MLADLPDSAREMVRDVLDLAVRSPRGWPQWDTGDVQGGAIRSASVGQLSVNEPLRHLSVLIVWLG